MDRPEIWQNTRTTEVDHCHRFKQSLDLAGFFEYFNFLAYKEGKKIGQREGRNGQGDQDSQKLGTKT
jgi:hypothetical protein